MEGMKVRPLAFAVLCASCLARATAQPVAPADSAQSAPGSSQSAADSPCGEASGGGDAPCGGTASERVAAGSSAAAWRPAAAPAAVAAAQESAGVFQAQARVAAVPANPFGALLAPEHMMPGGVSAAPADFGARGAPPAAPAAPAAAGVAHSFLSGGSAHLDAASVPAPVAPAPFAAKTFAPVPPGLLKSISRAVAENVPTGPGFASDLAGRWTKALTASSAAGPATSPAPRATDLAAKPLPGVVPEPNWSVKKTAAAFQPGASDGAVSGSFKNPRSAHLQATANVGEARLELGLDNSDKRRHHQRGLSVGLGSADHPGMMPGEISTWAAVSVGQMYGGQGRRVSTQSSAGIVGGFTVHF